MPGAGATIQRTRNEEADATSTVRIELPNQVVVTGPSMSIIEQTCAEAWRQRGTMTQQGDSENAPPGTNPGPEGADSAMKGKRGRAPVSEATRRKLSVAMKKRQQAARKALTHNATA